MPGRSTLSEEAEKEEREGREQLRVTESRLRELWGRRDVLLGQVHSLSEEQKVLFDARGPKQAALEATHHEHVELGRKLAAARARRDAARRTLDEAIAETRVARETAPSVAAPAPAQLRREIADLEHRQETNALPLAEENALIDRIRALRKRAEAAEKSAEAVKAQREAIQAREEAVRTARRALDQLAAEMQTLRVERDRRMASMRDQLVTVGQLVAQIREKSRERTALMGRLNTLMTDVHRLEREATQLVQASRARRAEATRTLREYSRSVRGRAGNESSTERSADAQLEELLKRGRVTLGG